MTQDLDRFVEAQDAVWPDVTAELAAGSKRTHWMWFVFPQLAGLGQSAMSRHFAIAGMDEARAYLAHPVLSERLHDAVGLAMRHRDRGPREIFGSIDAAKFRSSLTLFKLAAPEDPLFGEALDAFYDGVPDARTRELLGR